MRREVKGLREGKGRHFERLWWQFAWPRQGMRDALAPLRRYVAIGTHGKRMSVAWADPTTLPSNAVAVFAFDDDYSMGILLSSPHESWAWARSSTIGVGLRYTTDTAFETFPWPDPVTPTQREAIAAASRALYESRSALCLEHNIGLTKLYNLMDEGGFQDLAALHKRFRGLLHSGDIVRSDPAIAGCRLSGVVAPNRLEALYFYASLDPIHRNPAGSLRLEGLDPDAPYRVTPVAPFSPIGKERANPRWWDEGAILSGRVLAVHGIEAPPLRPEEVALIHASRLPVDHGGRSGEPGR